MSSNNADSPTEQKRCFVVMGFGTKTDYATGRKLDLNKSYRLLIKPVVEERGVICVRADEIKHSGSIDKIMYEELLKADVVIADISTANPNALYELGVRHALRPRTTIVISEDKLPYPFDLNHILISGYKVAEDAIDYDEVVRFRKQLGEQLDAVLKDQRIDSPVYTYLNDLDPPSIRQIIAQAEASQQAAAPTETKAVAVAADIDTTPLSTLIEEGENAIEASKFITARDRFEAALKLYQESAGGSELATHSDPYILQRLVLATYKSKQPDEIVALNEGMELLTSRLNLNESNDPETVGLGGAVEKRLYDKGQGDEHLQRAIRLYGRGYHLRSDHYNGINLAYLLNVRTDTSLDQKDTDKIADLVFANRIRREVQVICEQELKEIDEGEKRAVGAAPDQLRDAQRAQQKGLKFWCLATKAEAHFGLGEMADYEEARVEAQKLDPAVWMMETFDDQVTRLRTLLDKHGHLLDPPWSAE